jgi:hypothetical protein
LRDREQRIEFTQLQTASDAEVHRHGCKRLYETLIAISKKRYCLNSIAGRISAHDG